MVTMRKDLINNTEGLRIAKPRTECEYSYSGDTIQKGYQGLLFRMKNFWKEENMTYQYGFYQEAHRTEKIFLSSTPEC